MRWLICIAVVAVAVIAQLTIVDRIAFPGGTGPDLVLIAVAALALAGGPLAGSLIGFWAGLALDVAPPGSHFVGQDALVFCLIGYACGLVAAGGVRGGREPPRARGVQGGRPPGSTEHTALFEIVVIAAGAVCGEALAALLGVMLSDPRVTWPAVTRVLPVAAAYDVVLCPFVLFAAAAALRLAGSRRQDRAAWSGQAARTPPPRAVATPGSIRQVSGANTPRLRLSERTKGEGWIGGARGAVAQTAGGRPAPRREPRLNLAGSGSLARGGSRGPAALGAAFATSGAADGAAKVKFGTRRGEGVFGGSLLGAMTTQSGLAGSGLTRSRFGRSRMGRSLLGGSVFSRSPSALTRPAPRSRPATLGRSSFLGRSPFTGGSSFLGRSSPLGGSSPLASRSSPFGGSSLLGRVFAPHRAAGLLRTSPGGSATGQAPRFARRSTLARLTGALRRSARRQPSLRQPTLRPTTRRRPALDTGKSPGRGWLRGVSSRRGGLGRGRGWTSGSTPRLGSGGLDGTARLRMPRRRSKRSWRTGGYR